MRIRVSRSVSVGRGVLAGILVAAMSAYSTLPVFAGNSRQSPDGSPETAKKLAKQKKKFNRAVGVIEQHLTITSAGTLQMNVKDGASLGIDQQIFSALQEGMEQTNLRLESGELKLSDVKLSTGEPLAAGPAKKAGGVIQLMGANCDGPGATVTIFWWGVRIEMNECLTQVIINALWVGAGVTGLCAILALPAVPVSTRCLIAAAVFTIGAGALGIIDGWGGNDGIGLDITWTGQLSAIWPL